MFTPGTNGKWNVSHTWSIPGHTDGLKVDPSTHLVWSLQNEDANPTLVIINPATFATTKDTITSVNHGGGFDDIAFSGGKVFFTASNPSNNPNTDPAVVQVTLNNMTLTANTSTVLFGNAAALRAHFRRRLR